MQHSLLWQINFSLEIKNKTLKKTHNCAKSANRIGFRSQLTFRTLQKVIEFNILETRSIIREFEVPMTCLRSKLLFKCGVDFPGKGTWY